MPGADDHGSGRTYEWSTGFLGGARGGSTLCIGIGSDKAIAQDAEQFRGKQIRLVIGSAAGGGYDLFARTIATYWTKHIPGNPTILPQNLPGASSMQAANHVSPGPKDGTVIGAVNPQVVTRAILDPERARIDARQFTWIGSALRENPAHGGAHATRR